MTAYVELRTSKDGGNTWSDWKSRSLGDTGDFIRPAVWRRLGNARHFTFDVRADGCPDILAASVLDARGEWQDAPFVGGAYSDENRPFSAQDCVNYLPVAAEKQGARSNAKLRGVPGWRLFSAPAGGIGRGAREVEGKFFVVRGTGFYQIHRDTSSTLIGTIPGTDRVTLTHNQEGGGSKVVISNGFRGWTYDTITEEFSEIDDEAFPGLLCCDYLDQFILGIEPQRRFAFHSELADARSYSSLDQLEAESSPDRLMGQAVIGGQWWLLGERTTDVFYNTGAATGTFQRVGGSTIERGLAGTHAVAKMDNALFVVGDDGNVYRSNGYSFVRISTHPIEQALRRCDLTQCFMQTYEDAGHKIVYITCPDGMTWGYDVATSEWHRRESYGLTRWRMATLTKWAGVWMAMDYQTGAIYQVDWAFRDEDGQPLVGRRTSGAVSAAERRFSVNGVRLLVDTGQGTAVPMGIHAIIDPLVIYNRLGQVYVDTAVEHRYRSTGGVRPHVFSIATGSLPDGLSMDSDGNVTGTPTTAGECAWRVRVTDFIGNDADLDEGQDGPLEIEGPDEVYVGYRPPTLMTNVRVYDDDRAAMTVHGSDVGWTAGFDRVAMSPDGLYCIGADSGDSSGVFIEFRKFNPITEAWDLLANPAFMPTFGPDRIAWHPTGEYVVMCGTNINANADDLILYSVSGDTFTKVADPEFPSTNVNDVRWDSTGQRLGFALANSSRPVGVYDFSVSTGTLYNLREMSLTGGLQSGLHVSWLPVAGARYIAWASGADKFGVARVDTNGVENAVVQSSLDSSAGIFFDASGSYLFILGKTAPDYVQVWQFQGSIIGSETLVQETPLPTQPASTPARGSLSADRTYLAVACSGAGMPTIYSVGAALPPVLTKLSALTTTGATVSAVSWTNFDP